MAETETTTVRDGRSSRWMIAFGEPDLRGVPEVFCRGTSAEFCFRLGRREGELVWLCLRREKILFNHALLRADPTEAAEAIEAALPTLLSLRPGATVWCSPEWPKSIWTLPTWDSPTLEG